MKKFAKILTSILILIIASLLCIYCLFIFLLPPIINSQKFNKYINEFIEERTGIQYVIDKIHLKTNKNLSINLSTKNISTKINFIKKNISVSANNIELSELVEITKSIQKKKSKGRKFIENFSDITGTIDVNIDINKKGIWGKCDVKNVDFIFLILNTPVKLNDFPVYFNGDNIETETWGIIGNEKAYTNFKVTDLLNSKNRLIKGYVHSDLTKKFTDNYMRDFDISGNVDTKVSYYISKSIPQINYHLIIRKGSNLKYKNFSLDLTDENRRLLVKTTKREDKLYITHYDYSTQRNREIKNVISGTALFQNKSGILKPQYITLKTQENTPVCVAGSFGDKLEGGTFNGNLYYDFNTKKIIGTFNLSNSNYEDFYIEYAEINANRNKMQIKANGTYFDSPYRGLIEAENDFEDKINIYNLDLFLDTFDMKNVHKTKKKKQKNRKSGITFTIQKGKLKLNKLIKNHIIIDNIEIFGNLTNQLVTFNTSDAKFAKGILKANGTYNTKKHLAEIDFSANNIDADKATGMVFNLYNQVKGTANASLKAKIQGNFKQIDAQADFSIKEGYLPQIGNSEITLFKSKRNNKILKMKVSDIIKTDVKKSKDFNSDITGSFNLKDKDLNDIKIYSQQKYLSMYINGDYDLENEHANIQLFGNYNRIQGKRVKIIFVPLSVIMKILFKQEYTKDIYKNELKEIPPINSNKEEIETFRIKLEGNLNKNDINVELKRIR